MNNNNKDDVIYSDFWTDEFKEHLINEEDELLAEGSVELIKMANARRAISNFVQILTNKNIPVKFSDNSNSKNFTDGKTVYLSAKITEPKDFDFAVGVSLHEASHILLSDFNFLKTVWGKVPDDLYKLANDKDISKEVTNNLILTMTNYIEDRYVDNFVYSTAPGYRGYYVTLYDEAYNRKEITDMLESNMYRNNSIDAYKYRIINLTNPNTDLSALPGLDRKSTRLNSSHTDISRMPSSA